MTDTTHPVPAATGDRRAGGRIELRSLCKSYGAQPVLKGIDLVIESGEFFSLLGPSGCGKTTTLRLIGGFEQHESGQVLIDGDDIGTVPPERRPVNTVFQSYALFPHLTVADNVGFGLRFQDVARVDRERRVREALDLVRLGEYAKRKPHQLSGGQQQRVALARALVLRPRVLLLDEPLGALDAKLRRALQFELKALHREVGITFVYVTHDQEEALTMSDRLAVMRDGEIEQVGAPRDVYDAPASAYVADFLGLANLLPARVEAPGRLEVDGFALAAATGEVRGACTVFARPERLRLIGMDDRTPRDAAADGSSDAAPVLSGEVRDVVFVGSTTHVRVAVGARELQVVVTNDGGMWVPSPGTAVGVVVPFDAVRVLAS
ncbi:MAG: ABC transporter ATP-binding protein [Acidimicrobiales bacterium]|nr:ABC transporter ATP-binding protein [Acidimicrobiales bacterium]